MTRMPVCYESEAGQAVENPTQADLDMLLGQLDSHTNSYASLTMDDGSYIQVGGGPEEFTVEIREMQCEGSFRHLKAGVKRELTGQQYLTIGGATVSVMPSQILDLPTTRQLFRYFLNKQKPDPSVFWQDLTSMFAD